MRCWPPIVAFVASVAACRVEAPRPESRCADVPLEDCPYDPSCSLLYAAPAGSSAITGEACFEEMGPAVCVPRFDHDCADMTVSAAPPDDPAACMLFGSMCTPPGWGTCDPGVSALCARCTVDTVPGTAWVEDLRVTGLPHLGRALATGDVDGDGAIDLLTTADGEVVVLYGPFSPGTRGVGASDTRLTVPAGTDTTDARPFFLDDLDGDDAPELGVGLPGSTGNWDRESKAYVVLDALSAGTHALDDTVHLRVDSATIHDGTGAALLAPGDLTGDDVADLVVAAVTPAVYPQGASRVAVFAGPLAPGRMGLLEAPVVLEGPIGFGGSATSAGDLTGDGAVDLLFAAGDGGKVWLVPGPVHAGMGSSSWLRLTTSLGSEVGDIALGDLDGDGSADLAWSDPVVAGTSVYSVGRVYVASAPWQAAALPVSPDVTLGGRCEHEYAGQALAIGDLTGDGVADLVATTQGETAGFVHPGPLAPGTRLVSEAPTWLPALGPVRDAALADLDGDGDLDLAIGTFDEGVIRVWFGPTPGGSTR